jgi:hypothetical protein
VVAAVAKPDINGNVRIHDVRECVVVFLQKERCNDKRADRPLGLSTLFEYILCALQ